MEKQGVCQGGGEGLRESQPEREIQTEGERVVKPTRGRLKTGKRGARALGAPLFLILQSWQFFFPSLNVTVIKMSTPTP